MGQRGDRQMKTLFARFVRETEAQDLIEYALLAAGIALAAVAAINGVGTALSTKYGNISTSITNAS
jgi:pilus assembly protein Flp/PilA